MGERKTQPLTQKQWIWLAKHPGILTEIAAELKVTRAMVSWVFRRGGNSRDNRIEKRLAKYHAPEFREAERVKAQWAVTK